MLLQSQLIDALHYMQALEAAINTTSEEPGWGNGLHLWLPNVIPLAPDYEGESPVAWLVSNDFNGYDLTTEEPSG